MRALMAAEMLDLWEQGAGRHPLDRAALLAAVARPDLAAEAVADLPLGDVTDGHLALRIATFGPRITGHVDCACCGERLELALDATALRPAAMDAGVAELAGRRLRPPTLRDLAAVAGEPDAGRSARRLLALCTLSGADGSGGNEPLDDAGLREFEDRLEALDPGADLSVRLACVACGHENTAALDVGALLWDEIEACARRLIEEVHRLARAYGWSEAEILDLSPARRSGYLAMAGT